jgi:hypothetical protein
MNDTQAASQYVSAAANVLSPTEPADSYASKRLALEQANLNVALGKLQDARSGFARAQSGQTEVSMSIDLALGKAKAELLAGDAATSAADARHALRAAQSLQSGSPYSNRTGLAWLMLGSALETLGDNTQAHKAFEAAVDHLSNTVDADHPALTEARRHLSAASSTRVPG